MRDFETHNHSEEMYQNKRVALPESLGPASEVLYDKAAVRGPSIVTSSCGQRFRMM